MRFPRWLRVVSLVFAALVALVAPIASPVATAQPPDPTAAVEPAVARIDTQNDYQAVIGAGTGIVVEPGGQVLTNYHVVQGADRISATVGGRSYPASLLGYDRGRDVAVIQLQGAGGLPVAPIGDSAGLAPGEPVVALGNANGTAAPLTREAGTVTAFGRTIEAEDELTGSSDELTGLFEFAAPVRAGDSGGPVIDTSGRVVGITTAASVNYKMGPGGKGFAIPINDAFAIGNQIRARIPSETVHIGPPALLGVGVRTGPADVPGVVIQEVLRGGPAEAAGLHDGDVLIAIDGARLDSATSLTYTLDRHYPGDVVDVTWIDRSGQQRTGKATLAPGGA